MMTPPPNPYWNPQGNIPGVPLAGLGPGAQMPGTPGQPGGNAALMAGGMPNPAGPQQPPSNAAFGGPGMSDDQLLAGKMSALIGATDPKQLEIKQALARAQGLRQLAGDATEGIAPSKGRAPLPNYLGGLASVIASYKAGQADRDALAAQQELSGQEADVYADTVGPNGLGGLADFFKRKPKKEDGTSSDSKKMSAFNSLWSE